MRLTLKCAVAAILLMLSLAAPLNAIPYENAWLLTCARASLAYGRFCFPEVHLFLRNALDPSLCLRYS
jgi:hypothetical protein